MKRVLLWLALIGITFAVVALITYFWPALLASG
jgi:hypothetical protein